MNKNISSFFRNHIIILVIVFISSFLFVSCEEMLLGPEAENSPKSNFEILWKRLDENYALFTVKHINWDSLHLVFGAQLSPSTTETELWDDFSRLIQTLNDGHVVLINNNISKIAQSTLIAKREWGNDFSLSLVKNNYLQNPKIVGDGYITYGKIKSSSNGKNIGYIHILTFAASNTRNGYEWAYDIDKAVRDLYDCDALIIDLRNNGGGLKVTGQIIASVFVDKDITYFYQQEKIGTGHNDFGEKIPLTISPRKNALNFNKKIALLTNRFSASGSEHFAQIFKFLPYATQIGDTTLGCFGDIVGTAQLPNGWNFWYPVRLTEDPNGYCPEGIGIIPAILVENTKKEINSGKDNVLIYANDYLSK